MLRILLNVIELLMYFVSVLFIGKHILGGKTDRIRFIIGLLILVPVLGIMFVIGWEADVFYIPFVILAETLVLKMNMKNLRFRSLVSAFLFLFFLNTLFASVVSTFLTLDWTFSRVLEMSVDIISMCLCIIVSLTNIGTRIRYFISYTPLSVKRLILALSFSCCTLSIFLTNNTSLYHPVGHIRLLRAVSFLLIILVILSVTVLISYSVSTQSMKKRSENYKKQIKAQLEQYELLSRSNHELRRFRHDFNNMYIGLRKLIEDGKNDEALKMLEGQKKSFSETMLKYDTGNGIVDALLTDKQQKAEKNNTFIQFEGIVPNDGKIEPADLCVIFGNTIDNAVEACALLGAEEKHILVKATVKSGLIIIVIRNPVDHKVQLSRGLPITTKRDKKMHGFGLYSLKKILDNYDGGFSIDCSDKEFCISIRLEA